MLHIPLKILISIHILLLPQFILSANFCKPILCNYNKKHVGCNNSGAFAKKCGKMTMEVDITPKLRKYILDKCNEMRNLVAGGKLAGFKTAYRMPTMQWDDDLAKLASYNVRRCEPKYDECRNTEKYERVAQILTKFSFPLDLNISPEKIIDNLYTKWYLQHIYVDQDLLAKYRVAPQGVIYYNFIHLIADLNTHMGCAIVRQNVERNVNQFMTCNLSRSVLTWTNTYKPGNTAVGCFTGVNPEFPNLCSVREVINENDY